MCDLWKHSLAGPTPRGAIPAQIREGLARLGGVGAGGEPVRQVKLYNGGSFFDAGAVPVADHAAVAAVVGGLERVVVECHPALVGERVLRFRDRLAAEKPGHPARLEVAMGLETVHPGVLAKLNKRMTAGDFAAAASFLVREGVDVRAFVLVQPPFMGAAEAVLWAVRSAEFAFDCGVSVVSLIPVRAANGAVEALARLGHFTAPRLETLEAAVAAGIELGRGRVFADLWDLESFSDCPLCFETRRARLDAMNRTQRLRPSVGCRCRESGGEPGGVAGDA